MVIIPCHNMSLGLTARDQAHSLTALCPVHATCFRTEANTAPTAMPTWEPRSARRWSCTVVTTVVTTVVHVCEKRRAKELQNEVRWKCCRIQGPLHWTNRLLLLKRLQIVAPFNCCKKNEKKHASKDFNKIVQKISKNSIVTSGQLMSTPMHLGWNRNHHLCNRFWRLLVSRHGHLVSFNMSQPLEPGTIGSMNISSPQKSESCLIGKAQEDSFSSFDHAPNLAISTYQMTYISTFELGNTDRRILQLLRFYVWKLEDTR